MAVACPRQVSRCPGCLGGPLPRVRPPNLPSSRGPVLPVGSHCLHILRPLQRETPAVPGRRPTPTARLAWLSCWPPPANMFFPSCERAHRQLCPVTRLHAAQEAAHYAGAREGGAPFPLEAPVAGAQPPASLGHTCPVAPSAGQAPGGACSLCWGLCVAACPPKAGSSVCFQNPPLEELSCRRRHSFPNFQRNHSPGDTVLPGRGPVGELGCLVSARVSEPQAVPGNSPGSPSAS